MEYDGGNILGEFSDYGPINYVLYAHTQYKYIYIHTCSEVAYLALHGCTADHRASQLPCAGRLTGT